MNVIEAKSHVLSNFETYKLLQEVRRKPKGNRKYTLKPSQNLMTVTYEVMQYLEHSTVATLHTHEQMQALCTELNEFNLSKAEKLQIVNLRPATLVELHAIIEDCEERPETASEESMQAILDIIAAYIPAPAGANDTMAVDEENVGGA